MAAPVSPILGGTTGLPTTPPAAPTAAQREAAMQWDAFTAVAVGEVTDSAKAMKEGLASIITTAAAGLFLVKVPDISTVDAGWKTAAVVIALVATVSGLIGIWWSLRATAGTPSHIERSDFESRYGTVDEFRRKRASDVLTRLAIARGAVVVSVFAMLLGAGVLWLAPTDGPQLSVKTADATYCGTLKSGDQGEIHLAVKGERDVHAIKLADVLNLWVSATCS